MSLEVRVLSIRNVDYDGRFEKKYQVSIGGLEMTIVTLNKKRNILKEMVENITRFLLLYRRSEQDDKQLARLVDLAKKVHPDFKLKRTADFTFQPPVVDILRTFKDWIHVLSHEDIVDRCKIYRLLEYISDDSLWDIPWKERTHCYFPDVVRERILRILLVNPEIPFDVLMGELVPVG